MITVENKVPEEIYRKSSTISLVSIVIRCKDEGENIGKTLDMLFNQIIDVPFEIVAVDSGSTDDTLEIVRRYTVKILTMPSSEFSYGHSLNYGIKNSFGEIICCLSAHCIPLNEKWLYELIKPILEGKAHATFGRQLPIKGINPFEEVSLYRHFSEDEGGKGRVPFSNANCAFLKEMWVERRFDEEMPSWEDYLWYLLMKGRYRFKYCPDSMVYHSHPFSMEWIKRRAFIDGQAFKLIKKKYGIDLLEGLYPGFGKKIRIFIDDVKHHLRLFKKNGYMRQMFLIPLVRLNVYKSYRKGYRSIR